MKKIIALFLTMMLVLFLAGCNSKTEWNGKILYNHVSMVFDETDMYQYIGAVDYVFVGKITEENSIIKDVQGMSSYKIEVLQNLKGELSKDIECRKYGGMLSDGTMVLLESDRIKETGLPIEGETYIIMAYAQPDGSLTISEFYGDTLYNDENLGIYEEYIQNEIILDRKRFISEFDASK